MTEEVIPVTMTAILIDKKNITLLAAAVFTAVAAGMTTFHYTKIGVASIQTKRYLKYVQKEAKEKK